MQPWSQIPACKGGSALPWASLLTRQPGLWLHNLSDRSLLPYTVCAECFPVLSVLGGCTGSAQDREGRGGLHGRGEHPITTLHITLGYSTHVCVPPHALTSALY